MKKHRINIVGFSLLEVLVVLAILGVFSTFAVLSYSNFKKTLWIKNAAREVENLLSNARTKAVNQNSHFQVVYDFRLNKFWIDEIFSNGSIKNPKIFQPFEIDNNIKITDISIDSNIYSSNIAAVHFYPNGRSSYAKFHFIRKGEDESASVNYYTVITYPSTGYAHTFPNEKR